MLLKNKLQDHHLIDLAPEIVRRSKQIFPIAGYFVLLFASIDYLSFLVPFHLFDSTWALETVEKCVNNIWSLLLGLVMVFAYRSQIKLSELRILAWLSRLVLIIGIIYFLVFPLAITSSVRIYRNNLTVLNAQLSQQSTQYQQQKDLLNNATIEQLAQSIQQRNSLVSQSAQSLESPQELRQRLVGEIEHKLEQNRARAKANFQQKKLNLIKTAVKYSVGSIISGVMLIWISILTDWTRKITASWQEEN